MEIKTIKGIDEETWRKFKILAAKYNLKLPLLLKTMINEFEKNNEAFWRDILTGERNLSDKEAEDLDLILKDSRKERGFRE